MKTRTNKTFVPAFILMLAISAISLSFVNDKREIPGSQDPVKLTYNMTEGKSISYNSFSIVNQAMDIQGQTVNVNIDNTTAFKVKMTGKNEDNLKLEITMDSLIMKVESMQGSTGGKIKDVEGKSFNMLLSPLGKEVDVTDASKIEYTFEGTSAANLSQLFSTIFPDLPEKPVKPGDTWSKNDTVSVKTSTTKTNQILLSTYKFEGVEKMNGVECAKITSTVSGTMESNVQNMGMDIFYSGPLQGTVTLYFAVSEGFLVMQESVTKMNGTVEITGPQNMSFPVLMETKTKLEAGK
jgi:hypothetical protein